MQRTSIKQHPVNSIPRPSSCAKRLQQNKIGYNENQHMYTDNECMNTRDSQEHTYRNSSSSRILENIVDRDFMNKYEGLDPISTSTTVKNMGQNGNNSYNTTSKFNNLMKDFGHLDHLLQIQHHRESSMGNIDGKYRQHRISNLESYNKYEEDMDEKIKQRINNEGQTKEIMNKSRLNVKESEQKKMATEKSKQQYPQQLELFEQPVHDEAKPSYEEQQQQYIEMIIQLNRQNSITLKVHIHDDPLILAKKFCYTHNIDPKIITTLGKQIKQLQFNTWMNNNITQSDNGSINNTGNKNSRISHKMYNTGNNSQQTSKNITNNEKENQELYSNINMRNYNKEYFVEEMADDRNFNTNTKTKMNSKIKYNTNNNVIYPASSTPYPSGSDVFERLYKNSQNKTKQQIIQREKEKALCSQQTLRNYPNPATPLPHNKCTMHTTDKTKQSVMNQSTTFIHNLSTENANTSNYQSNNNKTPTYQVKIYEKNTKLQKQSRIRNQCMKEQMQAMKEEECTRNPQINPLSRLIVEKLRESKCYETGMGQENMKSSHMRLYERDSKSKEKNIARTIQYIREKEERQMKECTFRPKILKKSQYQKINTERYLLLHEDFYIRQNKAQTVKASESKKIFKMQHPEINEISKKLVGGRSFTDRMVEYRANAQKNKEKLEKQRQSLEKYRPEINKNSKNNKKRNVSIGQYLYSKSLQKKSTHTRSQSNFKKQTNKLSTTMYEEMKRNAFRYIFALMDSDQDGLISALKINILGLQTQILQLLVPLLCEMEQVKIQLDEDEFIEALQRLFNTFSIHQKNMILNVYKNPLRKSKIEDEPSFHPSLNQKSIQLARQVRQPGVSLYEVGKQKQFEKQSKLNQLRALKTFMEFQECTFHPNLLYHH